MTHQISGNVQEPRANAGGAAKLVASLVRSDKAVLRQILGGLPVPQGCQEETKDPWPVQPNQRIEIL
jgi:hypothetical protein